MWQAADYMRPWMWYHEDPEHLRIQAGWYFRCPMCDRSYVLPTEFGYRNTQNMDYPLDLFYTTRWTEQGDSLDSLSLYPSIVCRTKGCEGHYWVQRGKIILC